jgi:hypothetical protein
MFDLERAISEWRQQMLAAGIKFEALDELESHLRDDIEQQVCSGTSVERALEIAIERLGKMEALESEFTKLASPLWKLRALKITIACVVLAGAVTLASFAGLIGLELPSRDYLHGGVLLALLLITVWAFATRFFLWKSEAGSLAALTPATRQTLEFAGAEARRFGHDFIGTEHSLLGLLDGETRVVEVLRRVGVDQHTVRLEIKRIVGGWPAGRGKRDLPYTPRLKRALALATAEASAMNHRHVRGEHLLLGLLREGEGVAARVLNDLRVDVQRVRAEVLRELGGDRT